ncbi:cadherin domain-containing protein [Microvirga sp. Mcv34]|uniref:cadherin domain-containing protein n=1 Tax=Microvirga sp. Mcv34 TaxID=2926016 RepID=UPI0021C932A8|nr:cadherin domain-containing protein [Microvirga sp. Mcv34]
MSYNLVTAGGETRLNTTVAGNQSNASYTFLPDGHIVATWSGAGVGDESGSFQQVFDAKWNRIGGETRVNVGTENWNGVLSTTALGDGRWISFWLTSNQNGPSDILFRVFGVDGTAGPDVRVNDTVGGAAGTTGQRKILKLANGNMLVAWAGNSTRSGQEDDSGMFFHLLDANGHTIRSETRINAPTDEAIFYGTVETLSDGGWVAVYRSRVDTTNNLIDFWQQAYNADGSTRGSAVKLTPAGGTTTSNRFSFKELANGQWATFWQEGATSDIYYQVFGSDGASVRPKELATASAEGIQSLPIESSGRIPISLPNGGFLLLWKGKGTQPGQEDDSGSYYERFDANGVKLEEVRIHTTAAGTQSTAVAYNTYQTVQNGQHIKDKTVFLWTGNGTQPGQEDPDGIFLQMVGADGIRIGSEVRVNTTTAGIADDYEFIPLNVDGRFAVTWSVYNSSNDQPDIFVQLFDGNGTKIGSEVRVSATPGNYYDLRGRALPNGNFVLVWQKFGQHGDDIYQQVFDANGNRIGGETLVNTTPAASRSLSTFEVLSDGSWIVGWEGNGTQPGQEDAYDENTQEGGIFFQRFSLNADPTGLTLSGSIQENAAAEAIAGTLAAVDPDPTSTFTYSLVDANGAPVAHPLFEIVGNTVRVKAGAKLDFETAAAHTLRVKVADGLGGSYTQDVTVTVTNVLETTPFRKTGTSGNDSLRGELGNDILTGLAGDDILGGDLGKDRILTGTGRDIVVFDTKPGKANRDTITDFDPKKDAIHLDNAIFTKLGKKGSVLSPAKMSKGFFALGSAHDRNDYVVYDKKTGVLSYDKDGSGAAKAVEIAVFTNKPALTAADFFVI